MFCTTLNASDADISRALRNGLPSGLTKVYYVDYLTGSDSLDNTGLEMDSPLKTIARAYALAESNKNQGIALMGNTTHTLTSMLTVAKSRVHMFGHDPGGRMYGQNAKISLGVTTAVTDIGTMLNTGVRNSFNNIKFINENTVDEGLYCVVESGEFTVFNEFEIYKSTDLDETAASELVLNGDSSQFFNGTIGSLANAQTGTTIRPCVALNNNLAPSGTKQMRECYFNNVRMLKHSGDTSSAFVWWTADADVERSLEFKNCRFENAVLSAATPAVAVGGAAALTVGRVILSGDTAEIGCTALATQTGVFVTMPTYAAGGGSGIQAT
jgi:hypothetical protein